MPVTYAPPLATGLATDVPVKKADLAAWLGQIAAAITGVEASQSRVYASRDEAVTQVTASPPPEAVTRIVSTEGSALVIRGRSASGAAQARMTASKAVLARSSKGRRRRTFFRLRGTWKASSGMTPRRRGSIQWIVGS